VLWTRSSDRLLHYSQIIKLLQQLPDHAVVLEHAIRFRSETGLPLGFGLEMRPDVHPRRIEVAEEGVFQLYAGRSVKSIAAAVISSSTVSMRLIVRGPVSWILPSA
jgi:hypothetical protein